VLSNAQPGDHQVPHLEQARFMIFKVVFDKLSAPVPSNLPWSKKPLRTDRSDETDRNLTATLPCLSSRIKAIKEALWIARWSKTLTPSSKHQAIRNSFRVKAVDLLNFPIKSENSLQDGANVDGGRDSHLLCLDLLGRSSPCHCGRTSHFGRNSHQFDDSL
jgi:hypothetical protein